MPRMRVTSRRDKTFTAAPCYAPRPMAAASGIAAFPALRDRPAPPDISSIDPRLDLEAEIRSLKRQKNAVLLAHYYQEEAIQDLADFVGDSLDLSRKAQASDAKIIAFAGVRFMAETAKILNPTRKVVLPDYEAGCSLEDSCPADAFRAWRAEHPGAVVADLHQLLGGREGALGHHRDVVERREDRSLDPAGQGDPLRARPPPRRLPVEEAQIGPMTLWPGACIVHETVLRARDRRGSRTQHPGRAARRAPRVPRADPQARRPRRLDAIDPELRHDGSRQDASSSRPRKGSSTR